MDKMTINLRSLEVGSSLYYVYTFTFRSSFTISGATICILSRYSRALKNDYRMAQATLVILTKNTFYLAHAPNQQNTDGLLRNWATIKNTVQRNKNFKAHDGSGCTSN